MARLDAFVPETFVGAVSDPAHFVPLTVSARCRYLSALYSDEISMYFFFVFFCYIFFCYSARSIDKIKRTERTEQQTKTACREDEAIGSCIQVSSLRCAAGGVRMLFECLLLHAIITRHLALFRGMIGKPDKLRLKKRDPIHHGQILNEEAKRKR